MLLQQHFLDIGDIRSASCCIRVHEQALALCCIVVVGSPRLWSSLRTRFRNLSYSYLLTMPSLQSNRAS